MKLYIVLLFFLLACVLSAEEKPKKETSSKFKDAARKKKIMNKAFLNKKGKAGRVDPDKIKKKAPGSKKAGAQDPPKPRPQKDRKKGFPGQRANPFDRKKPPVPPGTKPGPPGEASRRRAEANPKGRLDKRPPPKGPGGRGPPKGPGGGPPYKKGRGPKKPRGPKGVPPKGPRRRPNLDRFGPCQACYAVVAAIDTSITHLTKEEKEQFDFKGICTNKAADYRVVLPPRGGTAIVQGEGLPDLISKMGGESEVEEADPKLKARFMKDFHKVCTITTKDKDKMVNMFEVPKKAAGNEKSTLKWKGGIRRHICSRYCKAANKTEL